MSTQDIQSILKLRVPVIVRLAYRKMKLREVMNLAPGSLVELPRPASEPLDLMVNNKQIGSGSAVKVGENFGLQVAAIGPPSDRLQALAPSITTTVPKPETDAAPPASSDASSQPPASDASTASPPSSTTA